MIEIMCGFFFADEKSGQDASGWAFFLETLFPDR
jgi:hypothetical protein